MAGSSSVTARRSDGPEVSIILATLNERQNLPELLVRIRDAGLTSYELLVVDDGSTDGTRELLTEESRRDSRIRPIFHEGKQTTLRAQCQGIDLARGRFVVIMDADLQHPPELLPELVQRLEAGAALAVASRYTQGGSPGPRTLARAIISRGAEGVAKALLPPARRVSDPVSGYFGFSVNIWKPLNSLYRGYKLLLFVLVMSEGHRVSEVGFRFVSRTEGVSKVTEGPDFLRLFLVEVLLASRLRRGLRRAASFATPGGTGGAS